MKEKKNNFKTFIINSLIFIIILIFSVYLYSKYIGTKGITVREYKIQEEGVPANFSGTKVIYFSDLLYGSTVNANDLNKIKDEINLFNPDIVIFGGDLIMKDYKLKTKDEEELRKFLTDIDANLGKYASLGSLDNEKSSILLSSGGFNILENKEEYIYNNGSLPICIIGVGSFNLSKYDFEEIFKCDGFKIAITHEGDLSDKILKNTSVNVILSGNSIGGEIRIPFLKEIVTFTGSKKYKDEYYEKEGTKIYVSNGIGTKKYYKRLFNRPSFSLFRLKSMN